MKILKVTNTIAFAVMVLVNLLANLIPIGGKTTGEIADAYPSLFTPAGMTFSIWGVIYLLLCSFILYQWGLFRTGEESNRIVRKTGIFFAVSCGLNILWILCWHAGAIGLSIVCIAALLIILVLIQKRIRSVSLGWTGKLTVRAGFDLYFGWIIAATMANISVWLVKVGWDRFGLSESFWTIVLILVGTVIGILVVTIGKNRLAACAVIWAYVGILVEHFSPSGYNGEYPLVITMTIIGVISILASIPIAALCSYMRSLDER